MRDLLGLLVQVQSFTLLLYSRIFELALEKADIDGSKAVHIGNSYVSPQIFCELRKMKITHTHFTMQELDYVAAQNAGMKSLLLVRNDITVCT